MRRGRRPAPALFSYLEVFYNRERRHSSPGYLSHAEFEQSSRFA